MWQQYCRDIKIIMNLMFPVLVLTTVITGVITQSSGTDTAIRTLTTEIWGSGENTERENIMTSHQQLSTPGIIQCAALDPPDQDLHIHNIPDLSVDIVITATIMGRVGILSYPLTTPINHGNDYDLITQSADNNIILTDYWDNQTYPTYQGGFQFTIFYEAIFTT